MASKQKYRLTFRCGNEDCGREFRVISVHSDKTEADCPSCKRRESARRFRVGDGAVSDTEATAQLPKGYAGTDRYECLACGRKLSLVKEVEEDRLSHCYKCGSQDVKYIGQAMSGITSSTSQNMIKALDNTAQATMKTYGMTDINLNSNMRPGDNCAPKLPPRQQQQVDAFFDHGKSPFASQFNRMGKAAIAGAFRDPTNPVAALHAHRDRPGTQASFKNVPVSVQQASNVQAYDKIIRNS